MDVYGLSTSEQTDIDDLLDLSNDEFFPSASDSTNNYQFPPSEITFSDVSAASSSASAVAPTFSMDFTHELCLPSDDDVAELEWLSQFVEDSFTDFPSYTLPGIFNPRNDHHHSPFLSKARSKRSRAVTTTALNGTNWKTKTSEPATAATLTGKSKTKREIQQRKTSPAAEGGVRRCSHCASEKTPQWRTGPLGPKTLCNACGVRYKSGRLVPEYRPAASPTFVLSQHSNSHRKVLELRRQKEQQVCRQHHRQLRDFEVC
ncbi:GATA transcription factor 2 [Hibiscus syriacus]|uniref:GATA transcription factor n=1 Tax=Hibiscus syriacus TaxID=106335 RepID=A0A6A2XPA5_HIBSY|nr:GATA transcription factor 4-like [Hibiscus syriacus]KAE8677438.1 GATA transcription factor 2 [Hibiscus syriacus]